ncbi:Hypothetical protein LCAKO_0842 [Lacticaseibacillus paracasei subsp. paracasei]|uniref:Uncharacterized protein n=1 Tax=Lacticaseibacillus paracasei subsp. paracasei TaxID=47714 RepID=A0AAP9HH36_LACPA|nr:hypothetical protein BLL69_1021 [Lacticaseibacillus paracasei]QGV17412.1 Hypothetical protein LCAKO_0842 [Lacticaseibacillus paracasei subsp. paracasei]
MALKDLQARKKRQIHLYSSKKYKVKYAIKANEHNNISEQVAFS